MTPQFEAFREKVRAAGAHHWDDIPDPDAFIREQRGKPDDDLADEIELAIGMEGKDD